ncbi:MAG: methyl-accepting chemotaxis protein [Pseudomonadota bacterium]
MSSWSVSKQIYTSFGAILALLLVLGGVSIYQVVWLGSVFTEYRQTGRETRDLYAVMGDVLETRMAAFNYRLTSDPDKRREVEESVAAVVAAKSRISDLFRADVEGSAALNRIVETISEYRSAFDEFAVLRTRQNALLAEMNGLSEQLQSWADGHAVSAAAIGEDDTALLADAAASYLAEARLAVSGFMASADLSALDLAAQAVAEASLRLTTLAERAPSSQDAQAALQQAERYAALLGDVRTVAASSIAIASTRLDRLGPQITAEIETLALRSSNQQDVIGPKGAEIVASAYVLMLVIALGALVFGVVLAVWMGRVLSGKISQKADTMDQLAGGDLEIEITGTEHAHELGRMARALETFRANAKKVADLAREKEANEAAIESERRKMMAELQEAFGTVVDAAVQGNFEKRVPTSFPDPELNHLAENVNRMLETVQAGLSFTLEAMDRMAEGQLEIAPNMGFSGAFAVLEKNIHATVEKFRSLVAQIRRTSTDVARNAVEISGGATELSSRVEQQASALEETAATMEEMSATVRTNAENSQKASTLSSEASRRADRGRDVVKDAVSAMTEIEDGARKISDIISVIDGIAFQTNLLALNAAVEAARAGEAGKGFAVVASEVRSLAQRSGEAARDIRRLIQTSSDQVVNGVRLVEQAGTALDEIVDGIQQVAQTIRGITDASSEQATGIAEISESVSHMDQMTQQNAALAQQSSTSARSMEQHAETLDGLVGFFKTRDLANRPAVKPQPKDGSQAA